MENVPENKYRSNVAMGLNRNFQHVRNDVVQSDETRKYRKRMYFSLFVMCTTCSAYASRQVSLNFYDQKMFLLLCTWPAPILTGILSVSCFDSTWCALDFIVTWILSKLLTQNEMKQNAKNELSMSDERMRWIYNSILLHSFWLSIRVIEKKNTVAIERRRKIGFIFVQLILHSSHDKWIFS